MTDTVLALCIILSSVVPVGLAWLATFIRRNKKGQFTGRVYWIIVSSVLLIVIAAVAGIAQAVKTIGEDEETAKRYAKILSSLDTAQADTKTAQALARQLIEDAHATSLTLQKVRRQATNVETGVRASLREQAAARKEVSAGLDVQRRNAEHEIQETSLLTRSVHRTALEQQRQLNTNNILIAKTGRGLRHLDSGITNLRVLTGQAETGIEQIQSPLDIVEVEYSVTYSLTSTAPKKSATQLSLRRYADRMYAHAQALVDAGKFSDEIMTVNNNVGNADDGIFMVTIAGAAGFPNAAQDGSPAAMLLAHSTMWLAFTMQDPSDHRRRLYRVDAWPEGADPAAASFLSRHPGAKTGEILFIEYDTSTKHATGIEQRVDTEAVSDQGAYPAILSSGLLKKASLTLHFDVDTAVYVDARPSFGQIVFHVNPGRRIYYVMGRKFHPVYPGAFPLTVPISPPIRASLDAVDFPT